MVGHIVKQVIVETGACFGNSTHRRRWESVAGNDHTVVSLVDGRRSGNQTGGWINSHRFAWIIKPWIENNHVAPFRMVGNDHRITRSEERRVGKECRCRG